MPSEQDTIISEYKTAAPLYEKLTESIEKILSSIAEKENIQLAMPIQARTKDLWSFLEKVERKDYTDPLKQTTDLSAARIVLFSEEDIKFVTDIIDESFKIDKAKSVNKKELLGRNKFGYSGINYVVSFNDKDPILADHDEFKGKLFEIQLLTMCQLVWAEMQRKIEYKAEDLVSSLLARRLSMLCALFELADIEFQFLLERGIEELLDKPITIRSLRIYLGKSRNIQKSLSIGLKEGVISRASPEEDIKLFNELYQMCSMAGFKLFRDLDSTISNEVLNDHLRISIKNHVHSIRAGPAAISLLLLYHQNPAVTDEFLRGKGWNENAIAFITDRD